MTEQTNTPTPTDTDPGVPDNVRPDGAFSFTVEGPASVTQSQGILATAVTKTRSPIVGRDVSAEDIVKVGEIEMLVAEAERMNFLTRDQNGRYIDVAPEDAERAHAEANKEDTPEVDLSEALSFSQEDADQLATFGEQLEAVGGDAVSALGQFLTRPDQLPDAVALLSEERGIDPADAQEYINTMAVKVDEAVTDYLITKANISPEDMDKFWGYVKESHLSKYVPSIVQAVFVGDGRPLKELAELFRVAHGSGMGAATPDMIETVVERGAEVKYVTIDGKRMRLEAARRAGLV